jgi:CHAT domain-containing protein
VSAIALPRLTWRAVDDWLTRPDSVYHIAGGFKYVVYYPPVFCLSRWIELTDEEHERARRRALPLAYLAEELPPDWATLRQALSQMIARWRRRAEQSPSGAERRRLLALMTQPLGEALDGKILEGVLDWFFQRAEVEQLLPQLGEVVMEPLRQGLNALGLTSHDCRIMLIPCGYLSTLPLHAAPVLDIESGTFVPFYETCACAYQASASLFATAQTTAQTMAQPASAREARAPFFSIAAPKPTLATPLPWAAKGALTAAALAQASGRTGSGALVGEHATRARLRALLARITKEYRGAVVEIATHGHSNPHDPTRSFLTLAHDEEFSLAELQRERLLMGVRCCIASGCFTAIGDVFTAPDELGSFAGGLLQAGAASAIASQWAIADRATFFCFVRFYWIVFMHEEHNLHQALREAVHWLRTASRADLRAFAQQITEATSVVVAAEAAIPDALRGQMLMDGDVGAEGTLQSFVDLREAPNLVTHTLPAFVNPDLDTERPFAHPIYWAGFVIYGA